MLFGATLCLSLLSFTVDRNSIVIYKELTTEQVSVYGNHRLLREKVFLPGSIFKLIVAQCLLESNQSQVNYQCKHNPQDMPKILYCSNRALHGEINLIQAIGYSCNNYFWERSTQLEPDQMIQTAKQFGLYLPPLKPMSLLDRRKFALGLDPRQKVSPMDMLSLTSNLAQKKCHADIIAGLVLAVQDGTAQDLKEIPINLAGKTGTGSIIRGDGDTNGWFIGFWPVDSPKYVLVTLVTHGSGGANAVPLAKEFLKEWVGKH